MLTKDFLQAVVTSSEEDAYFCMAFRQAGRWLEEWHKWPAQIDDIIARSEKLAEQADVYFSTYLFKAPSSVRENVLPTRTIQADLDNADVTQLPRNPTILVETSPGRHQAYWLLDKAYPLDEHESISRRLTYSIPLCDRSGWPLGRKVRIPNTLNHKYATGPKEVKVVRELHIAYNAEEFEALPEVPQVVLERFNGDFLENPTGVERHSLELLEDIKEQLPVTVYVQYGIPQPDRSKALWALMCHAFKAGLTRHQVFTLAQGSANNKFADLKHRGEQDLAKDVLRAENTVSSVQQDDRQIIQDLYKNGLTAIERKRAIYSIVLEALKNQGEFIHANNGYNWYIRRDIGRPVLVSPHSEMLQTLLDIQFGLNQTEPESRYVAHGLRAYVSSLPEAGIQSSLGHYDPAEKHLLLHTGKKTVLRITAGAIEKIVDGAYNIIFPWAPAVEVFTPSDFGSQLDWGNELFGDGRRGFGTSVANITNMTAAQATALLKVWTMFLLFRNGVSTRPILAAFGQPGSGKSTLFRKIYTIIYGRYKSISSVTNPDDFDHATANDPLVVFDNVDTWEKWLPDRIALAASTSDVVKRKLYTDSDTVTLRRSAILGLTAHNPKFSREDVTDRFLLLLFKRFETFVAEEQVITDVIKHRNAIWGAIVRDVQKVLRTPIPTDGIPQFRIEDFARYGLWIARAINCEADFGSAIVDVKSSQQAFSLEEEGLLVSAINKFVDRAEPEDKFFTPAQLWTQLETRVPDARMFQNLYRNSVMLSKKLSSMQASLQAIVDIEQGMNEAGARTWRIVKKEGTA